MMSGIMGGHFRLTTQNKFQALPIKLLMDGTELTFVGRDFLSAIMRWENVYFHIFDLHCC